MGIPGLVAERGGALVKPRPSAPFTRRERLNMTEGDCVISHAVTLPMVQGRETPMGNKTVFIEVI